MSTDKRMWRSHELANEWIRLQRDQVALARQQGEIWQQMVERGVLDRPELGTGARRRSADTAPSWGTGTTRENRATPRTRRESIAERLSRAAPLDDGGLSALFGSSWAEPVAIRPTAAQVAAATRETTFDRLSEPRNDRCPITQQEFTPGMAVTQLVGCGHVCESRALRQWFTYNPRCPLCRRDIRDPVAGGGSGARSVRGLPTPASSSATPAAAATGATPPQIEPPNSNTTALDSPLRANRAVSIAARLASEIAARLHEQDPDPSGNVTVSLEMITETQEDSSDDDDATGAGAGAIV